MKCKEAERLMSLQLDGDLSPERTDRLREHLQHCPGCHELSSRMARQEDLLRTALGEASRPTTELRPEVWEKLSEVSVSDARRRPSLVAWAGLAAASVLVGFVSFGVSSRVFRSEPSPGADAVNFELPPQGLVDGGADTVLVQQSGSQEMNLLPGDDGTPVMTRVLRDRMRLLGIPGDQEANRGGEIILELERENSSVQLVNDPWR